MAVSLRHIGKRFGRQQVLNDVNIEISDSEIVGLLGPNGAGKSTLMKILLGLWRADVGEVSAPMRKGYLPEQNPLYEDMYVREYIAFMCRLEASHHGADGVYNVDNKVAQLIELVGLTREAHKKIRELSKGYRQRVGLAQALAADPQLLILDEPTTGLDPNQLDEVRGVIRRLGEDAGGRVVILSTHILQEVREMCTRVIILDRGVVKVDRPMSDIEDLESLFREVTR